MKPNNFLERIGARCVAAARGLWKMLSNRLWMKLLSLLLAILLWNYVISSNTSITRDKTLTGLNAYYTGQSTLTTYGLALSDDSEGVLSDVTVQLEVAQSQYGLASADNVQVTMDLSRVRTAGTQEVPLRASTTYGRVTSILPESVTLNFEPLDSRLIPVNAEITGEMDEDNWYYNVSRTNPTAITISGAASIVRSITQARVYTDATGAQSSYTRAEPFVLLDGDGNEVSQSMLTRSASSITVMTDIYPCREIPISTEIDNVITGRVADGYVVTDISIQPQSVSVAADKGLLDGISELVIEPISVEGQTRSMSATANIAALSDFRYVSAEQVYVNITIAEESASAWIGNNLITFLGKADNLQLDWQGGIIQVRVTGPKSEVEALKENGIPIAVDLTGLGAGEHRCELLLPYEDYPNVTFEPEITELALTLTEIPEE